MEILRETHSICPECLKLVPGRVERDEAGVWLARTCRDHGETRHRLSKHPEQYGNLHDYYFSLIRDAYKQKDYILRTTDRCNLDCPICLASANQRQLPDYPKEKLEKFLEGKKGFKIDLMGAEPTMRKDLPDLIRLVESTGNRSALHTNGIALANPDYARKLKDAGLREVHLQFDGFSDKTYRELRGEALSETKAKTIDNLERAGISVDLKMTVSPGLNDEEMGTVLDFAAKRKNVKEVFYLTLRMLGAARLMDDPKIMVPDELIDKLEAQTGGRIKRHDIHVFQKLYFAFLHMFRVRKCFYNQHYIVRREKGGWVPLSEVLRMDGLEAKLDRYHRETGETGKRLGPGLRLVFGMIPHFLTRRGIGFALDAFVLKMLLYFGFDLSRIPSRNILIGFITACDPLLYDAGVSENCGKGDLSLDQGRRPSGSIANVLRDRSIYGETKAAS